MSMFGDIIDWFGTDNGQDLLGAGLTATATLVAGLGSASSATEQVEAQNAGALARQDDAQAFTMEQEAIRAKERAEDKALQLQLAAIKARAGGGKVEDKRPGILLKGAETEQTAIGNLIAGIVQSLK